MDTKSSARRRLTAICVTAAAAAAMTTACSGQPSGGQGDGEIELRMLVNITPNLTEEWWNDLVGVFEDENPGIDVKIQAPVAATVPESLQQLLATGNAPDVVEHVVPTPELQEQLIDLSGYDFATEAPLADLYTLDGKYYMAASGQQYYALMFYNKAAFAEAGIEAPPTTIDELEEDLAKLKAAGWTPIQTGGEWMTQLAFQAVGIPTVFAEHPDWYEDMKAGGLSWSESWGPIAERYAKWVQAGYIPQDAVATKYADAESQFLAGKSAIYPMGNWFAAAARGAENAPEIGVFAAPGATSDAPALASNAANFYAALKQSKNPEAAVKLIEWLTTDPEAVTMQLEADANFRSGFDYASDELGDEIQAVVDATPAEGLVPVGDAYGDLSSPGYRDELNVQIQGLLLDQDAAKVDAAMDAWWQANG